MAKVRFVFEIEAQELVSLLASRADLTVAVASPTLLTAKKAKKHSGYSPTETVLSKVSAALVGGKSAIGDIAKSADLSKTTCHHALAHLIKRQIVKRTAPGRYANV